MMRANFNPLLHPRDRRGRFRDVPDYIASILPNAHVVGGAVRDEIMGRAVKDHDFLAPGMGHDELRAALEPHGRVDDLIVDERKVGVRFYPDVRGLAESGIEIAPPRTERSTGKGRHDFEIVADASVPVEQDMERRDFTINAMAKNVTTGEIIDPLGGRADAENKVLRVIRDESFRDDGLRIARGLRFISQMGLTPDNTTREKMREWARRINDVSGERIGGGADGELSKLLMGAEPARALREARDTGVLGYLLGDDMAKAVGFEQQSKYHGLSLDEHIFETVQAAASAGASLEVRLAALFHDLGKPDSAWKGPDGKLHYYANPSLGKQAHEDIGARIVERELRRLKYPRETINLVQHLVREHMFQEHARPSPSKARHFLSKHGVERAFLLTEHKRADVQGKESDDDERIADELARLDEFIEMLKTERYSPIHVTDLAIDGNDLMALGFPEGPELGKALKTLLNDVLGSPQLNTREWLTAEAARILRKSGLREGADFERLHPRGRMGQWVDKPEATDTIKGLLDFLVQSGELRAANFRLESRYRGPEDLLLKRGKVYRPSDPVQPHDFPPEVCVERECFSNSLKIAALQYGTEDLTYVEGYAASGNVGIPVHHAWLVDKDGHVIDPTWQGERRGAVYVGIPFTADFIRKEAMRRGTDTIIDHDFPYYEREIPKGVVADVPGLSVDEWFKKQGTSLAKEQTREGAKMRKMFAKHGSPLEHAQKRGRERRSDELAKRARLSESDTDPTLILDPGLMQEIDAAE